MQSPYPSVTLGVIAAPSPYQRPISSSAPSDFIAKSEGALEEIGRWYGEGAARMGWRGEHGDGCSLRLFHYLRGEYGFSYVLPWLAMALRLRIKHRILFLVLLVSALIYIISIGYIITSTRRVMLEEAYSKVVLSAQKSANAVSERIDPYMVLSLSLASAFADFSHPPDASWRSQTMQMMRRIYPLYPEIVSLWSSWEYSAITPGYEKPYGRIAYALERHPSGGINETVEELSLTGDPAPYAAFKALNKPSLFEPYLGVVTQSSANRVLMTTVAAPMQKDGEYAGMVGCDIPLDWLQGVVEQLQPFEQSLAFLLSGESKIAAYHSDSLLLRPVEILFPHDAEREELHRIVREGREHSFIHVDSAGRRYFVVMSPINIRHSATHWSLGLMVPLRVIRHEADQSVRISVLVGLLALLILVGLLIQISNSISRPIERVTRVLQQLGEGEFSEGMKLRIHTRDEIERMTVALNQLITGLLEKDRLADSIAKGDLSGDITLLSDRDRLGLSLVAMRNGLREAHELQEQRDLDTERRTWTNQGLADFSEILRKHADNFEELCDDLLSSLLRFLGAEQGAIYLLDSTLYADTKQQEYYLKTVFAWGRKRSREVRISRGIGLVGACAMERELLFITDVPADYPAIPAAVGEAKPKCLVLIPLLHEGSTIGVIEIASFHVFEPYQLEFLKLLSVSVASSIFSVQIGAQTRALLQQSQEQAEKLKVKEEELRQNLEEMAATQENAELLSSAFHNLVASLASTMNFVEYDTEGYITEVGARYLQLLGKTREMLLHTYFSDSLHVEGWGRKEYEQFWKEIRNGQTRQVDTLVCLPGADQLMHEFYIPIKDGDGRVFKVIKLSYC